MTSDEDAFLAAMRAAPEDRTLRLVYADWLEDRGDGRHELVRTCEAMRRVPVWSDEYWALKARRNELWTACPIEWLEATGYDGSDYDPVFRDGVPDGVRDRWRLLREFTERWHGVPMPDVGGQRDVIAREEARLGLELPESVRELIAFAHDTGVERTGINGPSRVLANSFTCDIERMDRQPALRLFSGGLDRDSPGVMVADLGLTDPPIYYFENDQLRREDIHAPTAVNWVFAELLLQLFWHKSLFGQPASLRAYKERVAAGFPIYTQFDDVTLFESTELLVLIHETRVSVRARRQVPAEFIPHYLFEGDPPSITPLSLIHQTGLSREHWEATQRRFEAFSVLPRWVSVRCRELAQRTG